MQSAQRQPASRQMPVDLPNAEGKHGPRTRSETFKVLNALAKLCDGGTGIGRTHAPCNALD